MRNSFVLVLVLSLFCSHVIPSAFAAPVAKQTLSSQEIESFEVVQQKNAVTVAVVKAGADGATQAWATVGVVLVVIIGLAAMVQNNDDEETSK